MIFFYYKYNELFAMNKLPLKLIFHAFRYCRSLMLRIGECEIFYLRNLIKN